MVKCEECRRSWRIGDYDAKKYGNRCPHCGNRYLKVIRRWHDAK